MLTPFTLRTDVAAVNIGPMPLDRPYHHGDLRRTLVAAALRAARASGPDGVVLREAARTAGVSPTAAYRHFDDREHLLAQVAQEARQQLAREMQDALSSVPRHRDAARRAVARLHAVGRAYLAFAVGEPGLFRVAFQPCSHPPDTTDDPSAWHVLAAVLDELVEAGALHPGVREGAETIAWSSVHGLATLLVEGAFGRIDEADRRSLEHRVIHSVLPALRGE